MFIQWEQVVLVLQQDNTFTCSIESDFMILLVVLGQARICLFSIQPSKTLGGVENMAYFFVDDLLLHASVLYCGQQAFAIHEFASRHLQVEAIIRSGNAVVGCSPIGHHNPVEAPLLADNINIEEAVLGCMRAVDQVVRIHDGANVCLLHRGLECWQVDLA